MTASAQSESAAYEIGYRVFGPVFLTFGRKVLDRATADGVNRVAFVARDGEYLKRIIELVAQCSGRETPQIDYVYLSRVSTSLAGYPVFDGTMVEDILGTLPGPARVRSFFSYLGLNASQYADALARNGLSPDSVLDGPAPLQTLFADEPFRSAVAQERDERATRLKRYLDEHQLLSQDTALVDLGWKGSIPAALARGFLKDDSRELLSYYLAYWNDRPFKLPRAVRIEGLLTDSRKTRDIRKGAPYYGAFILEALCRARHGGVAGYEEKDGRVEPVFDSEGASEEERDNEVWRTPIRLGIEDFIRKECSVTDLAAMEKHAMNQLASVVFFPSRDEVRLLSGLRHTESFTVTRSKSLVTEELPSPWTSPRAWLRGLSSPWRSGYVMATGGRALALPHMFVEWLLLVFPGIRQVVRRLALRIAGMKG
jgi:hypothetical protein